MDRARIRSTSKKITGTIRLPSSKSISNRALIMRALSGDKITIHDLSTADDTQLLRTLLQLISNHERGPAPLVLDCMNAGTVMRFLTGFLAHVPGEWILTGSERMKDRPVEPLVNALRALGTAILCMEKPGYPPLRITGGNVQGGKVTVDTGISSQFISSLLMVGPALPGGFTLVLKGKRTSWPYVSMTLAMLREAGISFEHSEDMIRMEQQDYLPGEIRVEPDWSSAAFWYELTAFSSSADLLLEGLNSANLQGDAILPALFEPLGVKTSIEHNGIRLQRVGRSASLYAHDFTDHPDLAQPVIATCAGLNMPGRFTGLESLRIKETDRLGALQAELTKIGVSIALSGSSDLILEPADHLPSIPGTGIVFCTHGDHRMAMSLAPLSLVTGTAVIENPDVVAKSYPAFWDDLRGVGLKIKNG
jgi:3-phosphoshikimate 1-carboxyvinyltransferase